MDFRRIVDKNDNGIFESGGDDAALEVQGQALLESKHDSAGLSVAEQCGARVRGRVGAHIEVTIPISSSIFVQGCIMPDVEKSSLGFTESNDVEWIQEETATIRGSDEASNGVDVEAAYVELATIVEEGCIRIDRSEGVGMHTCEFLLMESGKFE